MDRSYIGFYARFTSSSKDDAPILIGSDTLVGDLFDIEFVVEDGRTTAWLKNKFDYRVGYFDADVTRKLQLAQARELDIRAVLSFIAYDDMPEPGHYWGEVAIVCTSAASADVFGPFIESLCAKLGEGVRPDIDLNEEALDKVFAEPGWMPSTTVPLPKTEKGSAIIKSHRSMKENMVEQGRKGNPGCYAASIIIDIVIVVLIIAAVLKLIGVI